MDHAYASSGVESGLALWSWPRRAQGALAFVAYVAVLGPFLVAYALLHTTLDAVAAVARLLKKPSSKPLPAETDQRPALVFPGTCTYVFWQMGMTQYLVERYDLRNVRCIGISSGGVAMAMIAGLEEGDPPREEVRRRALALYRRLDALAAEITAHPMAFLGRLEFLITTLLEEWLPQDDAAFSERFVIGMRRFQTAPVPRLAPARAAGPFKRADFVEAVLATANAPPVASFAPAKRCRDGWCADGVNVFSLWCVVPYLRLRLFGGDSSAAPRRAVNGHPLLLLSHFHPMWNLEVLSHTLARTPRSRDYWVTPTVGGHIQIVPWLLLVSRQWIAQLWADGYAHARDLDAAGHFDGLAPRRRAGGGGAVAHLSGLLGSRLPPS